MGIGSNYLIEQAELQRFCDWASGWGDKEDDSIYNAIPSRYVEHITRDPRTGRFVSPISGIEYKYNDETVVFAPDTFGAEAVVVQTKGDTAFFVSNSTTEIDDLSPLVGYHNLREEDL